MVSLNALNANRNTFAATWRATNEFGAVGRMDLKSAIYETVDRLIREFCAEFKAAN